MNDQHLVLLGEIKGKVEAQDGTMQAHGELLQSIDTRLRTQEQKAAAAGAVSGGVVSVGIALLIEGLKNW
ncbi:MAG: hypothetical protein Q8R98_12645, partial [Rubrivivax sp.]|nr:hypothetical protein [Rubrivivax sp.]